MRSQFIPEVRKYTFPDSLCGFYEQMYPRLLELLAESPADFQRLLDITLGTGKVKVINFELSCSSNSGQYQEFHAGTPIRTLAYH